MMNIKTAPWLHISEMIRKWATTSTWSAFCIEHAEMRNLASVDSMWKPHFCLYSTNDWKYEYLGRNV